MGRRGCGEEPMGRKMAEGGPHRSQFLSSDAQQPGETDHCPLPTACRLLPVG